MISKRLNHLDIARGLAIILVVWGHADRRMDPIFFQDNLANIGEAIYAFHMALFFIIAGTLIQGTLEKNDFQGAILKISKTTLLPFFSLSFAFMALNLLAPGRLLKAPTFLEMLQGVFLYQSSDWAPSGVLWFFFVLFNGAIIIDLLNTKLKLNIYYILAAALIIKLFSPFIDNVHLWAAGKFARNFIFLVLGVCFAQKIKKDHFELWEWISLIGSIVLFCTCLRFMDIYKPFFQLLTGVTGSYIILKCSILLGRVKSPFISFLGYCGSKSIHIFVFHMPFFTFIKPFIYKTELQRSWVGFIIWLLLGCILPLMLGTILQKIPVIHQILLGRKPVKGF